MSRIAVIETDLEILIPDTYVNNISERLQLYSRLDNIKDEPQLRQFIEEVKDRFGPLPSSTEELINTVRLRWLGERLGFEKISLKNGKMRAFFVSSNEKYFNSDVFGHILSFVQQPSASMQDEGHWRKSYSWSPKTSKLLMLLLSYCVKWKVS